MVLKVLQVILDLKEKVELLDNQVL